MSTELATRNGHDNAALMERVVVQGDLAKLTPDDRVHYYRAVCESVGLNPLTKPFDYIVLNSKLTLYAKRDATDQLRKLHGVSITALERDRHDDLYVVTAHARDVTGREDESTGAVSIANLKGEALANAFMKAETKAKRRVTLSICGLGLLDETEVASVPDARGARIDQETGEILDAPKHEPKVRTQDEPEYRAMTVAAASRDAWRWFAVKSAEAGCADHAAVCQRLDVKALKGDLPNETLGAVLDRLKAPAAPAMSDAEVEAIWGGEDAPAAAPPTKPVPPEDEAIDAEHREVEPPENEPVPVSGWEAVGYADAMANKAHYFKELSSFQKELGRHLKPDGFEDLTLGEIVRRAQQPATAGAN